MRDLIWYRKKGNDMKDYEKKWVLDEREIWFDIGKKQLYERLWKKVGYETNGRLDWTNENQEKKMGVGRIVDLTQRWKRWVLGE